MQFDELTDEQKIRKLQNRKKNFGKELKASADEGDKANIREEMFVIDCEIKNLKSKIERKKIEKQNQEKYVCKRCGKEIEEGRIKFFIEYDGIAPIYCVKCQEILDGSFLRPRSILLN